MKTFEIYRGVKRNIVDTSRAAPGVVVAWWSACSSTADELLRAGGRGRFLTNFLCVAVPILQFNLVSKSLRIGKEACQWETTRRGENQAVNSSRAESVPNLELAESLVYY